MNTKPTKQKKCTSVYRPGNCCFSRKNVFDEFGDVTIDTEQTEPSKQPIRARYLGHMTGYQPIRDQYFLVQLTLCTWVTDTYLGASWEWVAGMEYEEL